MRVKDVDFEIIPDFAFELGYTAAKKPRNNQRAAARSAWSMSSWMSARSSIPTDSRR